MSEPPQAEVSDNSTGESFHLQRTGSTSGSDGEMIVDANDTSTSVTRTNATNKIDTSLYHENRATGIVENRMSLENLLHSTSTGPNSPAPTTDFEELPEDENADESSEDDDDMSSEVSEGDDFQDELQHALEDSNFSFKGSFFHSSLLSAPNPCLHISGLGIVGLPLSDRDAKALISCATLAPFGRGERTVVNTVVRNTWEIEPAKITFANPQWATYLKDVATVEVCKSLGVKMSDTPPRMELYKLLLYEKGSHFLPHQDTQKANGMFATVIIILPSAYTGGEVILSHSSKKQTIDFAKESLLSTALLAWYTDVRHEVKEVTSGYRLALSFNLIHVAPPGVPRPSLPDMSDSMVSLRRVLKKWRNGQYAEQEENHLAAYVLQHQYSDAELTNGIKALKGTDAHRVASIQSVAEEHGFMLGLGSLEQHVTGSAEDCGYDRSYRNHRRWNYYDDEDDEDGEDPGMLEVDERTTSIKNLVDLSGSTLFSVGDVSVNDDCIIPKDPFKDETPDDVEYEGYMGNYAGGLEHWYHRTALVLIEKSHVDDICFEAGGIPYAYQRLKRSCTIPPTNEDMLWANRLLSHHASLDKTCVLTLMYYALKWNDLNIWKGVMKCTTCTLKTIENSLLVKAWTLFSFQRVFTSFQEILARSTDLRDQMAFIYSLPSHCKEEERQTVRAWCQKESDKILSSYNKSSVEDIPTIMFIIRMAGLESFSRTMMPNLLGKNGNYTFLMALQKALADDSQSILQHRTNDPFITTPDVTTSSAMANPNLAPPTPVEADVGLNPTSSLLKKLIKDCLHTASVQWPNPQQAHPQHYPYYGYRPAPQAASPQNSTIDRIIEIMEQAIGTDDMDLIKTLFLDIIKSPGEITTKFTQIYKPLIPRLKALLSKTKRDLYASPFSDLMQILISLYLRDVLGQKGKPINTVLRKIGCGCQDCQPLDQFILDPTSSTMTFRLIQKRRLHLEQRAAAARDICSYFTIKSGSPHGVQVTKHPDIVAAGHWSSRQKNAKAFLLSIGTDSDIARIMGARYPEVALALQGIQQFGTVKAATQAQTNTALSRNVTASNATSSRAAPTRNATIGKSTASSSSAAVPLRTSAAPDARASGKKRKSGPPLRTLGPVIDLTGEDSS